MTSAVALLLLFSSSAFAQQLPDCHFEDWTSSFNGDAQLKKWHGSNVEQFGFKFTFLYAKPGRTGKAAYVADRSMASQTAPGYLSLGTPWQYVKNIMSLGTATAGTWGGIRFAYRPDSMIVWIKREGNNTDKEDFHLLFYSWSGTAKGNSYKGRNGEATPLLLTNEESDIRRAADGNECGTFQSALQVAEGWHRDRACYKKWTRVAIPIYYMNSERPEMCNVILSAGNYPNFRDNNGLYPGNSLTVDDIELIYSDKIQTLTIGGKRFSDFDADQTSYVYHLKNRNDIPEIKAYRGAGRTTNTRGEKIYFPGRILSEKEINIQYGKVEGAPTVITVTSEDGHSSRAYYIKFVH